MLLVTVCWAAAQTRPTSRCAAPQYAQQVPPLPVSRRSQSLCLGTASQLLELLLLLSCKTAHSSRLDRPLPPLTHAHAQADAAYKNPSSYADSTYKSVTGSGTGTGTGTSGSTYESTKDTVGSYADKAGKEVRLPAFLVVVSFAACAVACCVHTWRCICSCGCRERSPAESRQAWQKQQQRAAACLCPS